MQSATAILSGNLPAEPNSFIGRERDLAELAKLLSEVRALTLSGPGGIGKTRLAVRLARDVIASAELSEAGQAGPGEGAGDLDEAWLVELADWHGQTAQQVATTIGIREEQGVPLAQTLAEALRSRHMLLILDTCEHQVSDCASGTPCSWRIPIVVATCWAVCPCQSASSTSQASSRACSFASEGPAPGSSAPECSVPPITSRASRTASRVLPIPPGPLRVSARTSLRSLASSARSRSRPIKLFGSAGRLPLRIAVADCIGPLEISRLTRGTTRVSHRICSPAA